MTNVYHEPFVMDSANAPLNGNFLKKAGRNENVIHGQMLHFLVKIENMSGRYNFCGSCGQNDAYRGEIYVLKCHHLQSQIVLAAATMLRVAIRKIQP